MKRYLVMIASVLFAIGSWDLGASAREQTKSETIAPVLNASESDRRTSRNQANRERKIPLSDATTVFGYYGVTPESPDEKRLVYALFPGEMDLDRPEKYAVHPAELWVCNTDGSDHRKLFSGNEAVHNGLQQSWVDNNRIVFSSDNAVYIINANTGAIELGPYEDYRAGHLAQDGKVLMYSKRTGTEHRGLFELDTEDGELSLIIPINNSINHPQYSPNGRKALFTTNQNTNLVVADLKSGEFEILPGNKPMHFQWFDDESLFGYIENETLGVDTTRHLNHQLYRWNLDGQIIEYLAGIGCHGGARGDGNYFAGESWYGSDPIVLRLYRRGQTKSIIDIFSHNFTHLIWLNGGRHHVNPSFSRDGMRLYYNKGVNANTSQAFSFDLAGLVSTQ